MILIISTTDRPGSRTLKIARQCMQIADHLMISANLFGMHELPVGIYEGSVYGQPNEILSKVLHRHIEPADQILLVLPEYNGGFPGVFKHFLDLTPPEIWKGKKIALLGVATGRSGNVRGIDHLTGVLHYLKAEVLSNKVYLSQVHLHSDDQGNITNGEYINLLERQIVDLSKF